MRQLIEIEIKYELIPNIRASGFVRTICDEYQNNVGCAKIEEKTRFRGLITTSCNVKS